MSWCTQDDGRCPNATDYGDCLVCARLEAIESAYWKRLYDATPRDVRALDYAPGHPERVRLDEEMRDAGRGRYVPYEKETRDCLGLAVHGRTKDNEDSEP